MGEKVDLRSTCRGIYLPAARIPAEGKVAGRRRKGELLSGTGRPTRASKGPAARATRTA